MSIKNKAYIVGIYEHPTAPGDRQDGNDAARRGRRRRARRAGLTKNDIDGYFCAAGDTPGLGQLSAADYLGLKNPAHRFDRCRRLVLPPAGRPCRGSDRASQMLDCADYPGRPTARRGHGDGHAAARTGGADARKRLRIALRAGHRQHVCDGGDAAHVPIRHHQRADAWVKVAASHHAQHNPHAMLRDVVTVGRRFVNSPMIADPLHRLDCWRDQRRRRRDHPGDAGDREKLKRPLVKVIGAGEAPKHQMAARSI